VNPRDELELLRQAGPLPAAAGGTNVTPAKPCDIRWCANREIIVLYTDAGAIGLCADCFEGIRGVMDGDTPPPADSEGGERD